MTEVTSKDQLLDGRVTLIQPVGGYRAAIDPVFLAASAPARPGDRVLDIGSGVGAASLCLAARVGGLNIVGLELQTKLVELAKQGADISGLADQVDFHAANLLNPPNYFQGNSFDHVMANPPYLAKNSGNPPPDPVKAAANVEGEAVLADWVGFALTMVRDGGTITFIHRYDRRQEVIGALKDGAGDLVIFPLWPKSPGVGAKRVLVQGVKGAGGEVKITEGLVLHDEDGSYTKPAEQVLRQGASCPLRP